MPNFSRNEVVLVGYPFSNLAGSKVRPAIIVGVSNASLDYLVVPITSRLANLLPEEFVPADWRRAGLNVTSAIKRGIASIESRLILKSVGKLSSADIDRLDRALRL